MGGLIKIPLQYEVHLSESYLSNFCQKKWNEQKSCLNFSEKWNVSKLLSFDFYIGFISIQLTFVAKNETFFFEKLRDKVINCINVGIEHTVQDGTIKGGVFLIRIKMSQKIPNFLLRKLSNTLPKIPK